MSETRVAPGQRAKTLEPVPITRSPVSSQTEVKKTNIATPIDLNLVAEAKRGDIVALDTLIAQSMEKVGDYIKKHTSVGPEQAQDLTHDSMLRAIKSLKNFEPQGNTFESWLFTVTRRTCGDFFDSSKRKVATYSIDDQSRDKLPAVPDFSQELVDTTSPSNPLSQLSGLTPNQRKILLLKMEDFKMKDIAKEMGISKSAANQLRQRAEAAAQKALGNTGLSRSIIRNKIKKTKSKVSKDKSVLSTEPKEPDDQDNQDTKELERAQISVEDIGIYLSGMAIISERRYQDYSLRSDIVNLLRYKDREAAFIRLSQQGDKQDNEAEIRTIFAPEIDEIIELRKTIKNNQIGLV